MKKGMLISFEGGEACGKTTQIKLFTEFLKEHNIAYISSKEPGGTAVGEEIRNLLLHSNLDISARAEALLFNASRAQLVLDVIKPALKDGKIVVMDRFFDSTYAYEGYAGKLRLEEIKPVVEFATDKVVPDLTFLFDITYEESMRRKFSDENLKNLDRFESKGEAYHNKVRQGYLELAKKSPERFCLIDASKPVEEIFLTICKEFEKRRGGGFLDNQ